MTIQSVSGNKASAAVSFSIAERELERRTPFFSRLWRLIDESEHEQPAVSQQQSRLSPGTSRKELAGRLPFFLRLWWLREYVGSEHFSTYGGLVYTLPLGSQYSDPLCDAGSSDVQFF